jgi:hypothetical protein
MTRENAVQFLRSNYPKELAEYYISEAEHGDGEEYWNLFADTGKLAEDVELFVSEGGMGQ